MKVSTIMLEDGRELTLRLTARQLNEFTAKQGNGTAPIAAVLTAVDDYGAKLDLLGRALNHPGNRNDIHTGADLLDALADEGKGDGYLRRLIVDLAVDAGLLDSEKASELAESLVANGLETVDRVIGYLSGKETPAGEDGSGTAENPT